MASSRDLKPVELTREELAIAAGTSSDNVARLSSLGLILPADDHGVYPAPNVSRIRLLLAYESMVVSLEVLGDDPRSKLGLAFVDQLMPTPARLLPETYEQLTARIDAPRDLVRTIRTILGTANAAGVEHVRDDDAAIFELATRAKDLGASEEQLIRILRMNADSVRRIVRVHRDFIDEALIAPRIASGASEAEVLLTTAAARREFREVGEELTMLLLRRFMEDAVFQSVVERGERALQRAEALRSRPAPKTAIAFVDVSGYTALAETAGDEAAALAAARFALLVDEVSIAHGGRLIKLLGDGAMVAFPEAAEAVRCSLDLTRRADQTGLPPIHGGIDTGAVVRRDGDYFGSVVNVASRVAGRAALRQVLVTERVVDACHDEHDLCFVHVEYASLRNVARTVALYLASARSV